MIDVPVVLAGYGPVGRHYADLLRVHRADWRARYDVDLRLVAVRGATTEASVEPDGIVPDRACWRPSGALPDLLRATRAAVFAQAVPSGPTVAARAGAEALQALRHADLVTATKTVPLTRWRELTEVARATGRAVRLSATTGAALPAADLTASLRGFDVESVRGCLNGTAGYVLDQLGHGAELAATLADARRQGIAEADPATDLDGTDAGTKLRILTGLLWGVDISTTEVHTEPITDATAARAVHAVARGRTLRQVAEAWVDQPGQVHVRLSEEPASGTLGALSGAEKAVSYDCGAAGVVTVSGGRSSPRGAALAMIKDTIGSALRHRPGLG